MNLDTNKRSKKGLVVLLAVILVIAVFAGAIYVVSNKRQADDLNDVNAIKTRVGRLYLLPSNEEPALATVTDSKKISSSFAGKVQNGDKILIYQQNGKAIVYRPDINRIVDVEPVQIDDVSTPKK